LGIGLTQDDLDVLLPSPVSTKTAEHIATFFEPFSLDSLFAGIGPADVHNRDPRELALVSTGARVSGDGIFAQVENRNIVLCQIVPWQFEGEQPNVRRTFRHTAFMLSRLLGNMSADSSTPFLERCQKSSAEKGNVAEKNGFYLDQPVEWDYPYRFFRW
jgi:hypothetical protein